MKARYLSLAPLIPWRQAERPINWRQRFGRRAALEVEVGFGNGEFLLRRAQAHPERDFVGIEMEWASVRRGLRRIAQSDLGNLRLIKADARAALERLWKPESLHRLYSLFPCPWPKERHAQHRLFGHDFLKLLNSRLIENGEAMVVTDHHPYLTWIVEHAPGTGFEVHWQPVPPHFNTKYERKWHRQGQDQFYELRLLKQEHIAIPLKEDAALKTYRLDSFDPEHFQPAGLRGDIVVDFKEFIYDPERRKGMARVVVIEDHLFQHFWIAIVWAQDCWHISPARGCDLVPTAGLQRAIDLVYSAAQSPNSPSGANTGR